jgi:hypothetical protein
VIEITLAYDKCHSMVKKDTVILYLN